MENYVDENMRRRCSSHKNNERKKEEKKTDSRKTNNTEHINPSFGGEKFGFN